MWLTKYLAWNIINTVTSQKFYSDRRCTSQRFDWYIHNENGRYSVHTNTMILTYYRLNNLISIHSIQIIIVIHIALHNHSDWHGIALLNHNDWHGILTQIWMTVSLHDWYCVWFYIGSTQTKWLFLPMCVEKP